VYSYISRLGKEEQEGSICEERQLPTVFLLWGSNMIIDQAMAVDTMDEHVFMALRVVPLLLVDYW
jgi:hypothetical protein